MARPAAPAARPAAAAPAAAGKKKKHWLLKIFACYLLIALIVTSAREASKESADEASNVPMAAAQTSASRNNPSYEVAKPAFSPETIAPVSTAPAGTTVSARIKSYSSTPTAPAWHTYNSSLHYYYNQLSYDEKCVFSCLYDAIALGRSDLFDVSGSWISSDQFKRVYKVLVWDCPELMISYSVFNSYWSHKGDSSWFKAQAALNSSRLEESLEVVAEILESNCYGYSDFNKQLAFDRYIVRNCVYTHITSDEYAPYSALIEQKAVCAGYALGATFVLRTFGIPCIYVSGNTKEGGSHGWNLVQIGGQWYHYDPTWNDRDNSNYYTDYLAYFNLTDERMFRTRSYSDDYRTYNFSLPMCYSLSSNYYYSQGRYVSSDWQNRLPGIIRSARTRGDGYIGVAFDNETNYNAAVRCLEQYGIRESFKYWYRFDGELLIYFKI